MSHRSTDRKVKTPCWPSDPWCLIHSPFRKETIYKEIKASLPGAYLLLSQSKRRCLWQPSLLCKEKLKLWGHVPLLRNSYEQGLRTRMEFLWFLRTPPQGSWQCSFCIPLWAFKFHAGFVFHSLWDSFPSNASICLCSFVYIPQTIDSSWKLQASWIRKRGNFRTVPELPSLQSPMQGWLTASWIRGELLPEPESAPGGPVSIPRGLPLGFHMGLRRDKVFQD